MKGLLIFLLAVGGGGFATYSALCHGPLTGLHIKNVGFSANAIAAPTELTPSHERSNADLPLSLGQGQEEIEEDIPKRRGVDEVPAQEVTPESIETDRGIPSVEIVETPSKDTVQPSPTDKAEIAKKTESQNLINSIDLSRFEAIRGRDCKIGLKEIGFRALSLRRGSFHHGDTLLWDDKFAKNKRISMIYASANPTVRVKGLAFGPDGIPQAAFVQEKSSGREGVIALFVEGQNVPLIPVK